MQITSSRAMAAPKSGSIANVAGTVALAAGLLTGSASLTQAGYAGLSVSSVTNFIFNP